MFFRDNMTGHEKIIFTRKKIFDLVRYHLNESNDVVINMIQKEVVNKNNQYILSTNDKYVLVKLLYKFRTKFKESNSSYDRFITKNESWLSDDVTFTNEDE